MRARHRHFNPRDCNAALCLDSRFISGKSDNDNIEAWDDRSANAANAVQGTLSNRPIYKTAIQGGQPIVRFDGSNDFYNMTTPLAGVFRNRSYGLVFATVADRSPSGGNAVHTVFHGSTGGESGAVRATLRTRISGGDFLRGTGRRLDEDSSVGVSFANNSNWNILALESEWSNNIQRLRVNFNDEGTNTFSSGGGNTSNTDSVRVEIGNTVSTATPDWAPIDLGQLVLLNTNTSPATVKRIHHAAAYSFKIACN
jgi:hypothetical protein